MGDEMSDDKDTHQNTSDSQSEDLINKLDDLTARLNKIETDIQHREAPLSTDLEEQAIEIENDEVLEALENETNSTIESIRRALKRMEEGCYGVCISCGNQIAEERIKALPYAEECFECASKE